MASTKERITGYLLIARNTSLFEVDEAVVSLFSNFDTPFRVRIDRCTRRAARLLGCHASTNLMSSRLFSFLLFLSSILQIRFFVKIIYIMNNAHSSQFKFSSRTTSPRRYRRTRRTTCPRSPTSASLRHRRLNNLSSRIKHNINQRIQRTITICLLRQTPRKSLFLSRIRHICQVISNNRIYCSTSRSDYRLHDVA